MTDKLLEDFKRDGYVVIPSVLDREEVAKYRESFDAIFASGIDPLKGDSELVRTDVLYRQEDMRSLFFRKEIFAAARKILGETIRILPETSIMESQYGGWHKDTTSVELFGYEFHKHDDFNIVNAAIYLQDNDEWGGGLDVVPGSHLGSDSYVSKLNESQHKLTLKFGLKRKNYLLFRRYLVNLTPHILRKGGKIREKNLEAIKLDAEDKQKGKVSITSKAGDMVIFDLRLSHKATWPRHQLKDKIHLKKYAFFTLLAGEGDSANNYMDYLLCRAAKQYSYHYLFDREMNEELRAVAELFNIEVM